MWEKSRCYYVGIIELHRFKAILFCDFYEDGYFWNFLKNLFLLEFFYRGEIHLGISFSLLLRLNESYYFVINYIMRDILFLKKLSFYVIYLDMIGIYRCFVYIHWILSYLLWAHVIYWEKLLYTNLKIAGDWVNMGFLRIHLSINST